MGPVESMDFGRD
jgi:hypothetical protein